MRNVCIVHTCCNAGRGDRRAWRVGVRGGRTVPELFCVRLLFWCRDERPVTDVLTSHGVAEIVLYVHLSSVKLDCSCFF